ncbi:protein kinase [Cystoisospora suis]|uniref:Protein kinase n=1 Tax=Cystoisospora suis TaxID=483139 RepID=A0A2C6KZT6_9APIC|nr:protein kinase [Cystoisospora suis]
MHRLKLLRKLGIDDSGESVAAGTSGLSGLVPEGSSAAVSRDVTWCSGLGARHLSSQVSAAYCSGHGREFSGGGGGFSHSKGNSPRQRSSSASSCSFSSSSSFLRPGPGGLRQAAVFGESPGTLTSDNDEAISASDEESVSRGGEVVSSKSLTTASSDHPASGHSAESAFCLDMVDLRSKDDFRINYLRKLSYARVWLPRSRRTPNHQTVTIFDWDDTLLCTSFLNVCGQATDAWREVISTQLGLIQRHAKNLLELALRMGRVFIITNAMEGWVEYSCRKYLPGLLPVLQKLSIISARNRFEAAYPGEYHQWKIQAFLEVQRQLNSEVITNLISVGDSNIEMDAVHVMGKEFSQALVKTVKFRENPSPEELAKQLELVSSRFEKICLNACNLKIGLERKWVAGPAGKPARRSAEESTQAASSAGLVPFASRENVARTSGPCSYPSKSTVHLPRSPQLTPSFSAGNGGGAAELSSLGNLQLQQQFAAEQANAHLEVGEERHSPGLLRRDKKQVIQHQLCLQNPRRQAAELQGNKHPWSWEGGSDQGVCELETSGNENEQRTSFQQGQGAFAARPAKELPLRLKQKEELKMGATGTPDVLHSRHTATQTPPHRVGEQRRESNATTVHAVVTQPQCSRLQQLGKQRAVGADAGQPRRARRPPQQRQESPEVVERESATGDGSVK